MFDAEVIVLTEDIDQTFAHVAIDAALDGIIDRGDTMLYFK